MVRAFWVGATSFAILAVVGIQTAGADDVWEKIIPFHFHVNPAVPKNVSPNSNPVLDAAKIKAGLRTANPEEHGFIERVVDLAKRGKIPPSLVESTFQWARKRPFQHRFQYFKQALIERAKKEGIRIEDTDPPSVARLNPMR
jgi:hypothetical protein